MCSPVFLNRTLTYMRQRMSRSHKSRQGFKVDSILDRLLSKNKDKTPSSVLPGYMTLTFLGFYDKTLDSSTQIAQVETVLLKISHKKRKDSSSPLMQVSFGTAEVPVNPSEDLPPIQAPTISIPTESFTFSHGPIAKSHILLLTVQCSTHTPPPTAPDDPEPALKRRRSASNIINAKMYGSELTVYDKHNRCLLMDGDYELALQEVPACIKTSPKKPSTWESAADLNDSFGTFEPFHKSPCLKFKLFWSQNATNAPIANRAQNPATMHATENKENNPIGAHSNNNAIATPASSKLPIVYQFVYNNNSRQQTEACEDLHCPWCSLGCSALYTLLKHLKLCHSRFTFTYAPIPLGARIDVAINELYDGSYTGSPHDLISQPSGCAFSRNGPVRRACVTHILVCHPKRPKPSLSEFLELDDCEYDGQRPFITGHNRLYHHTTTCLPIYPKEMDVDSEGENDPEWLQAKTMMMIDEFTDVNEGEKELMKMWNLHVMKYGYVGDCQIPLACAMFLQQKGEELLLKNLYRNFVVHMCSLFDFGLVSAVTLYTTVQKLQEMVGDAGAIRAVLRDAREKQMDNWMRVGARAGPALPATPSCSGGKATPVVGRKVANVGMQRRKGTPTPSSSEPPARRKSGNEATSRKRLSMGVASNNKPGEGKGN